MRVCHYEDAHIADLEPLTLTRPVFDLLCGQTSLADKQARYFQASERTAVVRPHLAELAGAPAPTAVDGLIVVVNGRWLPPVIGAVDLSGPCVGLVGGETAYAVVDAASFTARTPDAVEEQMEKWKTTLPCREAGGRLFRRLWEIVAHNADQIVADDEAPPLPSFPPRVGEGQGGGRRRPSCPP